MGCPCLTPLLQWKTLPGVPFNKTEEVPEERMPFSHFIHLFGKPLCSIT
jgi:hypothetical protein